MKENNETKKPERKNQNLRKNSEKNVASKILSSGCSPQYTDKLQYDAPWQCVLRVLHIEAFNL